jgi:diaminopimelate decarboxylase
MSTLGTPYFLIDERRLVANLEVIRSIREASGARSVLALKCFSTWAVFGLMREYLVGTTSSSLFEFDLADTSRRYSRLGLVDVDDVRAVAPRVRGLMFHFNCENGDFGDFARNVGHIAQRYGDVLQRMAWVSLGGGIELTSPGYPVERLCSTWRSSTPRSRRTCSTTSSTARHRRSWRRPPSTQATTCSSRLRT